MTMKKVLIRVSALLVLSAAGLAAYVVLKTPETAPVRAGKVPMTPERIARGKYLFHNVALCADCHSPRDFSKYVSPVDSARIGHGDVFPEKEVGVLIAPNLTPDPETGLGKWTDGEKLRAIREGVSRDGHALFPIMPYDGLSALSDEDAESIVAYMNSLPPAKSSLPKTELKFPLPIVARFMPKPVRGPVTAPNPADRVAYGQYLSKVGGCAFCHSPGEQSNVDTTRLFAGGREFKGGPNMLVRSANLTPDLETGIGKWSEQRFLNRFAEYREYLPDENGKVAQPDVPATTPANLTVMHWLSFAGMKEDDLRALYAYLRTVPAQSNKVEIRPSSSGSGL